MVTTTSAQIRRRLLAPMSRPFKWRVQIFERSNWRCEMFYAHCSRPAAVVALLHPDDKSNVRAMCKPCLKIHATRIYGIQQARKALADAVA